MYHQLMTKGKEDLKEKDYHAQQKRFNVNKQIIFNQAGNRLQMRLRSLTSELIAHYEDNQMEMMERLQHVQCTMQEEFLAAPAESPKQLIRYMEADSATYHYKTEELIADHVKLFRYLMPGHQFISSFEKTQPLMQGTAEQIQFCFGDQNTQFKARGFQAIIQTLGKPL
jgi:hypothetical protein